MDSTRLFDDDAWADLLALGSYTQTRRLLRVYTPLGAHVLLADDLDMWEGIGPMAGPALGDAEIHGGSAMAHPGNTARSPFSSALGPIRAGLRLVLHAFCRDAHLSLKRLMGQPALVEMLCQDDATQMRPWHGHIVAAAQMGSNGGLACYRLVIEPWLSMLAHNRDAWVYQDMTVPQILNDLFRGYAGRGRLAPSWRWALADGMGCTRRSLCTQYHESDLDFAQRLMREEGLICWWEHQGDTKSPTLGTHTLVIADHNVAIKANVQPTVRFTASDHTLGADSLVRWADMQRVTSSRVAMRSRDHRAMGPTWPVQAMVPTAPKARLNKLTIVDAPGAYAYEDAHRGQRLAFYQAEALAAFRQRALARGPWRRAQAGTFFKLEDHVEHDGRNAKRDTFAVLAVQHRARNNFTADERARFAGLARAIQRDQGAGQPTRDEAAPLHEAALLVQPLALPVRMGQADPLPGALAEDGQDGGFNRIEGRAIDPSPSLFDSHAVASLRSPEVCLNLRPTVRGTQTAIVVGDGHGDVYTDRDGRVRVQFHWQRGSQSSHLWMASPNGENAPANASSSAWVRVGQSLAGANFGAVFTPRVGQEVLIGFSGGDIDRPVVLGVVYNGRGQVDAPGSQVAGGAANTSGNTPAWFPGQGTHLMPDHENHQHPAVMLGHKSQELGASNTGLGGYNQLVFDDSVAGNRIELSTTTEASRLQLGALLHQDDNQRLALRGHGLDLTTRAHLALRGGSGLLISAHPEPPSTESGQQLEARDAIRVLQKGQDLIHTLAESAQAHDAKLDEEPEMAGAKPEDTEKQLPTEQGLHALSDSLKTTASFGNMDPGASDVPVNTDGGFGTVAAWGRPDMVLAAPGGIGLFTPVSGIFSAGTNHIWSAGQDLNVIAQGNHATVAKEGAVFFTYGVATNARKPNREVGIKLHAATGSVHASSNTGATRLTASGAIHFSSTKTQVRVVSPTQINLMAAGAGIDIDAAGNITISAPGVVEFKATMKIFTSGPAAFAPDLRLATATLAPNKYHLRYVARSASGKPLANKPYTLEMVDGTLKSGTTDAQGRTEQVVTEHPEVMHLYVEDAEQLGYFVEPL